MAALLAAGGAIALPASTAAHAAGSAAGGGSATSHNVWNLRAASHVSAVHSSVVAAAAAPVVIGVDNTPPAGKNWVYTHYFPENNVNIPQGGVALFQWDQGSLNGLHSVTLIPTGETVAQARAAYPTVAPDTDNGEHDAVIPPQSDVPSNLTCSTGPAAPPCAFDGTAVVNSGIIPTTTGAAFAVQVAPSTPTGTYTYFCVIHPGMQGTINVVAAGQPASSQGALAQEAASELAQLNAGALAVETAAQTPHSVTNADGTKTWTVKVGVTADDVDLLEYLPNDLPIRKGDSVTFDASGTTQEPHTVSTAIAGAMGLAPFLPTQCEAASGPDTAATQNASPPFTGCADPTGFEQPLNTGLQGEPTNLVSLDTPTSVMISGRADTQAAGVPTSHTYKMTSNGTYAFFCFFHLNMGGVVSTPGYRLGASDGGVFTEGSVDFGGANLKLGSPVVAHPTTSDNQGYWEVTADGHTANFGTAASVGNTPVKPASPIVGAAPTADNGGLWLVASDGGVFALGDAAYMGSMGGKHLNAPIVGISADDFGGGYDLVASDGGVFNFGANGNGGSRFFGSMGGSHLNAPIVAIGDVSDGSGYVMVARDGGVFTFGSAEFKGSLGATHLNAPIVGMALTVASPTFGNQSPGYRLVASDGGVFTFGATFDGSLGATHLNAPIVGIGGNSV